MKRSVGVVLTSIVQFLCSLLVLLMSLAILFVAPHFASKVPNSQPQMAPGLLVAGGAMYFAFAAMGIATAIGVFRLKRWSRYSTLVFAGILVFVGLMLAVTFALMPFPTSADQSPTAMSNDSTVVFRAVMAFIQLAIAGLGGWWLYYFTRKAIRDRFEMGKADALTGSGRPLSIVVLAVISLIGLPWMLVGLWIRFPILLFGIFVSGVTARLVYLLFFALNLYVGIGLLRLAPASRLIAIGFYVFGCANTLLCWLLPGRDARYHRMLTESMQMWHLPNTFAQSPSSPAGFWMGMIFTSVFSAVAIYFLISRRSAFEAPPLHQSSPASD